MEQKKTNVTDLRENIIEFVKRYGPMLPVKLAKEIGRDITFTGAVLAELVANKKVLISNTKVGGSPVYYMPGQEARLQMYEKNLPGKEKDAFRLLREKKIIKDNEAEPWQRVALRGIKDFAVPINVVTQDGKSELFWKWYLTNDQEVNNIVSSHINRVESVSLDVNVKENLIDTKPEIVAEKEQHIIRQEIEPKQEILQHFIREEKHIAVRKQKSEKKPELPVNLDNFLAKKKIELLAKEIGKKGKEIDMVANVPSGFGKIKFFIAYRIKRKVNESDISMIFSKAQVKNLPAILLSNGELTKKAKEYLERDFKSVTFYKI